MNTVDGYFLLTDLMFRDVLIHWRDEINSSGRKFDFDSQDCYMTLMEQITQYNFKDVFEENKNSEFRKEQVSTLKLKLEHVTSLFEKQFDFFKDLDRESLRLKEYRKRTKSTLEDSELMLELYAKIELPQRNQYFNSNFYKEVGFLASDFHNEIYMYAKILLKHINENFKNYTQYDENYNFTNDKPFFPMRLISDIHAISNDLLFENIFDFDFYKEINYLHTTNKIRILKDQNNCFYYLIHLLSETIENQSLKEKWMIFIMKDQNIDLATYKSKYRYIVGADRGKKAKEYGEQLYEVFKLNKALKNY